MKIMVIDDSLPMRKIIALNLKNAGFTDLTECPNGKEALARLTSRAKHGVPLPDVILLDWHMPEMDGMELLKKLKADDTLKVIPGIMVTSESEKANVIEAIKAGALGYLVKPITPQTFLKQVVAKIRGN